MRAMYEEAEENRDVIAKTFLEGCAVAVASKQVQDVIAKFRLAEEFKITIPHPDTCEEYYDVHPDP